MSRHEVEDCIESGIYEIFVMDISEVWKKSQAYLGYYFDKDEIVEIIRQLFIFLQPNLTRYTSAIFHLPNYEFLHNNHSHLNDSQKVSIKESILVLGLNIYMSARQAGLFIGDEGENSFPFHLEKVMTNAAYLLVDKIAYNKYKANIQMD